MTTSADATADEQALAACLAGRPVPDGAAGLAAFTDAVRASATAPGRPNAALAELLATGLLVPTQEPSRGTAGQSARISRKRTRMLIPTLVAKFAAAGVTAKAAVGAGVVAVALAGATTATVVATQEPASVVENATTEQEPTTEQELTDVAAEEPATEPDAPTTEQEPTDVVPEAQVATEPTREEWSEGPAEGQSHGNWVSQGARQGWVDGETVSREAHARNERRKGERAAAPVQVEEPAEEPAAQEPGSEETEVEQPEVEEPAEPNPVTGQHGNGHGDGNGKNGR